MRFGLYIIGALAAVNSVVSGVHLATQDHKTEHKKHHTNGLENFEGGQNSNVIGNVA